MEKAIAYTYASDDLAYYFGERVEKSFKHFHEDIPFHILTLEDEPELFGDVIKPKIGSHWANLSIRYLNYLKDKYEIVIKLDADLVVTGRFDEILDKEYDIATSLNNKGVGGINYERFPEYCNLGVVAVRSKELAEGWYALTYDPEFIKKEGFAYMEQDVMNYLATCGKYKQLILDKEGPYYNETSREHWYKLKVRHKGLFIGERPVKALHWAGGGELKDKYTHPAFDYEVCKYLDKITQTEDFTRGFKEKETRGRLIKG